MCYVTPITARSACGVHFRCCAQGSEFEFSFFHALLLRNCNTRGSVSHVVRVLCVSSTDIRRAMFSRCAWFRSHGDKKETRVLHSRCLYVWHLSEIPRYFKRLHCHLRIIVLPGESPWEISWMHSEKFKCRTSQRDLNLNKDLFSFLGVLVKAPRKSSLLVNKNTTLQVDKTANRFPKNCYEHNRPAVQ